MTYVEYAKKLGISLNSAQIEILNLIEEQGNENLIISFPRISGRQMLYNLIERKKGYEQGIADRDKELAENNVFFSNIPIEELVLDARADERAKVLDECIGIVKYHENEYDGICWAIRELEELKEQK